MGEKERDGDLYGTELESSKLYPSLLFEFITLRLTFIMKKLVLNFHLIKGINSEQMQFLKEAD